MAGYVGSSNLQTSVANQEIIPNAPSGWTIGYKLTKLDLLNDQDCHLIINDGTAIFLRANQGFSINCNDGDKKVESLKIVENGITFNFQGNY